MKLTPLFDRVLLEREKLGGTEGKVGNVYVPNSAALRNAPFKGKVIAVGEGCDSCVEVGKTYIFGALAGTWINSEGKPVTQEDSAAELFICVDKDLLCKVNK